MAFSKSSRHPNCHQKRLEIGHCGACRTHLSLFFFITTTEELPLPSFACRILLRRQIILPRMGPIESLVGDLHCNQLHIDEYFLASFLGYVTELGNDFKSGNG